MGKLIRLKQEKTTILKVGDEIYYTGDRANSSAFGTITDIDPTGNYGTRVTVEYHPDHDGVIKRPSILSFANFEDGPGQRFHHLADYFGAERAEKIIKERRDREANDTDYILDLRFNQLFNDDAPDLRRAIYLTLKAEMPTDRTGAIKRIRQALKKRSGKAWSVKGGRGTAYGWIEIKSPPRRCTGDFNYMPDDECQELADLLGLSKPVHFQGEFIPAGSDYRMEYIERAEGRTPRIYGQQYWD